MSSAGLLVVLGLGIGLVIGLLGGGGAVLTVPALVYLAGLPVSQATATSLVVVVIGSVAGLVAHHLARRVRWREGLLFGALGIGGAAVGSWLSAAVPARLLLALFAGLLIAAGASMLRDRRPPKRSERRSWWRTVSLASGVGLITGFFGVGGGFVVVPALVLALGFAMDEAAATALVVVVVNATTALLTRGGHGIEAATAAWTGGAAAVGAVGGTLLAGRLHGTTLRRLFGVLLVAVAVLVITEVSLA